MKSIFPILFILLFVSCSNDDGPSGDVLIRVENNSIFDFEDVIVGQNEYGDIAVGEYSDYLPFEMAYRYGYIELVGEGESYILQPIDYVGETPLEPGLYTYQLDILNYMGNLYLNLTFLED